MKGCCDLKENVMGKLRIAVGALLVACLFSGLAAAQEIRFPVQLTLSDADRAWLLESCPDSPVSRKVTGVVPGMENMNVDVEFYKSGGHVSGVGCVRIDLDDGDVQVLNGVIHIKQNVAEEAIPECLLGDAGPSCPFLSVADISPDMWFLVSEEEL